MLLTLTTTHSPATDLGYLLHKHPARVFRKELSFGVATVFFSEAQTERATAALVVDVDSVGLVRNANEAFALSQYVNDRPYVASSLLSVAMANCFASALGGRCKDKPELASQLLPFEATIVALPAGSQAKEMLERLFVPLGYQISIETEHTIRSRNDASYRCQYQIELSQITHNSPVNTSPSTYSQRSMSRCGTSIP